MEGSTPLAAALGVRFAALVERQRALIDAAIERAGGYRFGTGGDSVHAAFASASAAVTAALDAQRALLAEDWPDGVELKVRMGAHTGEAEVVAREYLGMVVHEAARIADAGHGGQILLSGTTAGLAEGGLPEGASLRRLGEFAFRGVANPHEIHQLVHPDLPDIFGPLRTRSTVPSNLPPQMTSFVGRRDELGSLATMLGSARVVTVHGPGGSGKTRLAIEAAAAARDRFADGVWFVDLAPLQPDADPAVTAAAALGLMSAESEASEPPIAIVARHLAERTALVVLDNCEHIVERAARFADELLRAAPGVSILATSQQPLEIGGEEIFGLSPLSVEAAEGTSDAVRLFVERARQHDAAFEADEPTVKVIEDICARLDGLPLAIELAAAHVRAASVDEIARRLGDRFGFLTKGPRTQTDRQRTLRSAIDWGYGLLTDGERELLARLSVFTGGFTLDAAEAVCAGDEVGAEDVYHLLSSLVDRSLIVRRLRRGRARYFLLETIREYAGEKLATTPAPATTRSGGADVVLRREGDVWAVEHAGTTFRLKDSKGLRYLAELVAVPGRDLFVMDLIDAAEGAGRTDAAVRRAIGDAGGVSDRRAVQGYRQRLQDLGEELEEARAWNDPGRVQMLEAEVEALTRELAAAVNLRGEVRAASSATERARTSVTKAIKAAIGRIGEHDPVLGEHLSSAIRTGTRCAFEPSTDALTWQVRRS